MISVKRNLISALYALVATMAMISAAMSMSLSPIHIEMASTGLGSRAQITVTNDSQWPLPVEITVHNMTMDEAGGRSLGRSDNEFLVFPPQALVPAGQSQVFRLQWVGEPQLSRSESFLISANQIPVRLPVDKNVVQVVKSFGVVVNVAPPKGLPELKIVETGIETDRKTGKRHPTVTVHNSANVHGLLPQSILRVSGGNWSHTFMSNEMSEKIGIGLVQPGKRRKFVLPVELPARVTNVQATLDFRPRR